MKLEEREQEQMEEGGPYGSRANSKMNNIAAQKK
jgi:hypothetical protein